MSEDLEFLDPCFLGPAAENDDLLEDLLLEFLRDHVYWRRNFHPEDGQRIAPGASRKDGFADFHARTRTELYALSAELKRAVPFFHPRYVGHMASDLLLPGVVAKLLTSLYNPNNVAEEAAPVTVEKELAVGEQLATMVGYETSGDPCAWGHLTSGGTVANYEALWNFRSVKFYGLALQAGARAVGFEPDGVGPLDKPLSAYSKWELVNLTIDDVVALRREVGRRARALADHTQLYEFVQAVKESRLESLGTAGFFQRHPEIPPPQVLVPISGHYSWDKGMKVLGFGTANLVKIGTDSHMRVDVRQLDAKLAELHEARVPVLAVVGMLGSTEFGTVDPIHEIVATRARCRERGMDFGIHVDGAWGGYLLSMFRRADGSFLGVRELRKRFRWFPSDVVYEAFRAVSQTDSITIDPHKLGYVPYPAGAFVARNRDVADFVAQGAAYVFDLAEDEDRPMRDKLHHLGQYILEGSKPGAAAAAVYVTHKVLPLHAEGFGRLLGVTVRSAEAFRARADDVAASLVDRVRLTVPFEPDSNLVCLALNPVGNVDQGAMNRFGRAVFRRMRVEPEQPLQIKSFIGSYTSLQKASLPGEEAHRILDELGVDPDTFVLVPIDERRESDHIFVLRHTLMNPWLQSGPSGRSYIDLYWDWLQGVIDDVLAEGAWR